MFFDKCTPRNLVEDSSWLSRNHNL